MPVRPDPSTRTMQLVTNKLCHSFQMLIMVILQLVIA